MSTTLQQKIIKELEITVNVHILLHHQYGRYILKVQAMRLYPQVTFFFNKLQELVDNKEKLTS